jgi:hypothetical protein
MKPKETESKSSEPYYYIALVLKGSEKQYVNLLKYVNNRNGAKVIYQCKSLTYLHVEKAEGLRFAVENPPVAVEADSRGKA